MQQLHRYLLLSLIAISSAASAKAEPIIVDEEQADCTGSWQVIKETANYAQRGQFKYAMNIDAAEPTAVATFRPNIPVAGRYHVDMCATPGGNRSMKVVVVISGADGEIQVTMDQSKRPGGWQRIADDVQFNAGTSGTVRIRNNGGPMPVGKIVMADAVRFTATGETGNTFKLLTTIDKNKGGSILLNPKKTSFEPESIVIVTAEAEEGYIFNGWSGDATGMDNPLRLTMNKNKQILAKFVEGNPGAILEASEALFVGNWITNPARWGARTNYQFATTCIREGVTAPLATATYRPALSKAGLYDIYIWYSKGTNRCENAPWEIVGKEKSVNVTVNQQARGGDWVPIASGIEFEAGKKGYVKLSNVAGTTNRVVVADSVAFVYVGKP